MEVVNSVDIETPWGYKSFELYHGDIFQLRDKVDILGISAGRGRYQPTPGTIIHGLSLLRIDVSELAVSCEFDYRETFDTWISRPIDGCPFSRIICAEITRKENKIAETINNMFITLSVAEYKGLKLNTFAVPVLGAGVIGHNPELVVEALLQYSINYLERSKSMKKILFVEKDKSRVEHISKAIDENLSRRRVVIPKTDITVTTKKDIHDLISCLPEDEVTGVIAEVNKLSLDSDTTVTDIARIGRRFAEHVVQNLLRSSNIAPKHDLNDDIGKLSNTKTPKWIITYLHILRRVGNEAVHGQVLPVDHLEILEAFDAEFCLLCIRRVLSYWISHNTKQQKIA